MWPNPQETTDLVTFTEEILDGKLHFLCSEDCENYELFLTRKLRLSLEFYPCSFALEWTRLSLKWKCLYKNFSQLIAALLVSLAKLAMVARLFWKYVINGVETFYEILKICIVFAGEIFSADVYFFCIPNAEIDSFIN